jgi:hypothetical protein
MLYSAPRRERRACSAEPDPGFAQEVEARSVNDFCAVLQRVRPEEHLDAEDPFERSDHPPRPTPPARLHVAFHAFPVAARRHPIGALEKRRDIALHLRRLPQFKPYLG